MSIVLPRRPLRRHVDVDAAQEQGRSVRRPLDDAAIMDDAHLAVRANDAELVRIAFARGKEGRGLRLDAQPIVRMHQLDEAGFRARAMVDAIEPHQFGQTIPPGRRSRTKRKRRCPAGRPGQEVSDSAACRPCAPPEPHKGLWQLLREPRAMVLDLRQGAKLLAPKVISETRRGPARERATLCGRHPDHDLRRGQLAAQCGLTTLLRRRSGPAILQPRHLPKASPGGSLVLIT